MVSWWATTVALLVTACSGDEPPAGPWIGAAPAEAAGEPPEPAAGQDVPEQDLPESHRRMLALLEDVRRRALDDDPCQGEAMARAGDPPPGGTFGGSALRQLVGLGGAAGIARIEVLWPTTGRTQTLTDGELDQWIRVTEGEPGFEGGPRARQRT